MMTQTKLLRVLQEQESNGSAAMSTISVDVRILAAANKNLLEDQS